MVARGGPVAKRDANLMGMDERERVARAVEAHIRHLQAVPADVLTVPRSLESLDLQMLANDVRDGRYGEA